MILQNEHKELFDKFSQGKFLKPYLFIKNIVF